MYKRGLPASEILARAEDWLADPTHWSQGVYWRDHDGMSISTDSPVENVGSCCLIGAIIYAKLAAKAPTNMVRIRDCLDTAIKILYPKWAGAGTVITNFNDSPETQAHMVLRACARAKEMARELDAKEGLLQAS